VTSTQMQSIAGFTGELIGPGDTGYNDARAVWNVMHDRRPALIARCTCADDVSRAIHHANRHGLTIAVRGGGHSLPGHSTVDDGLVIDLRELNHVLVDPVARTVRVGGGALLGDVDKAVQAHGLVVPAGVVSHTGAGGLTLGGGVGRMMRHFGLTIDSLLGAEVVLADGRTVHASERELPDLFWGLRGGGGNFGVVTEFEFQAYPLGDLLVLATFDPLGRIHEVLGHGEAAMAAADARDELLWTSFVRKGPAQAPWLPEQYVGTAGVMSLIEWSGDLDEGHQVLSGIQDELAPTASSLDRVPYLAIQQITDELLAPGTLHAYVKAGFTGALTAELIDAIATQGAKVGSPLSVIEVLAMGGAIGKVASDATAFPHRSARWLINVPGQWSDAADTAEEQRWVRETFAALEPHLTGGAYSNFMEGDEQQAADVAYGSTLARLRAVKRRYDPQNTFRLNQNIVP